MKSSVTTAAVSKQSSINANFPAQGAVPGQGQAPVIGTFIPGLVTNAGPTKSVLTAGVSANPHHFPSSLANQNGVSNHMTTSQSQDPPTSSGLTNENGETAESLLQQQQQQQFLSQSLANTKEKTPMCLINELARFNRVTHQYTLVDEQGPAHKKTFFVKLHIGDKEEYSASGASIKKAQHAAAGTALEKTEFKHPPPKPRRGAEFLDSSILENPSSITPTVELNSLAMKRGEPAIYRNIENRNPQPMYYPHNYDFRGMFNQRYHYMRPPRTFYVSLKVGTREFIGEGISRQMARHNAAKKALEILRSLKISEPGEMSVCQTDINVNNNAENLEDNEDDDMKSEISLVHEIALRHNLPVSFDVIRESGPPHMKNFVTQCLVGSFKTEAEGNSKKLSKKRAAELMLKELRHLPALPPNTIPRPRTKPVVNKKKNRNLIKQMQKADPTYGVGINPISRLIQIQQAQKKKEPVYSLLAERGLPRRREFVMQVQVDEQTCTGVGPNKKLAKRHAAEAMLQLLGYNKPSPQPTKPAIKMQGDTSLGEKKVTFSDITDDQGQPVLNGGRQIVPGLIVLPEGKRTSYTQLHALHGQYSGGGGVKATGFSTNRAEHRLMDVCMRNNIEIQFDEFAGASNPSEYLSRLLIQSNPSHTLHGSGPTPEAARDAAAVIAMKILKESGLIKDEGSVNMAAGDGPQIKG